MNQYITNRHYFCARVERLTNRKNLSVTVPHKQMEKAAVLENRVISKKEMGIRKTIGMICMGIIALILIVFPTSRDAYASISVALAMSIGIWRTGYQSL